MNLKKVSIIVPAYNAERTIIRCVDSVLHQSCQDWELLIIDDGSEDGTAELCDRYASSDVRIKVLHIENGGVSRARNIGLKEASGEYLTFLDADDWLDSMFLDVLLQHSGHDMVVSGFERHGACAGIVEPEEDQLIEVGKALADEWNRPVRCFLYWYVWGKLFRTAIVRDNAVSFREQMFYNEDFCFVMDYLSHASAISVVKTHCLHHINDEGRSEKYKMSYHQLHLHVVEQEESFLSLERLCLEPLSRIRRNVYMRFFLCFVTFLRHVDGPLSYCRQVNGLRFDRRVMRILRHWFLSSGKWNPQYIHDSYKIILFPIISYCRNIEEKLPQR